MSPDTISRFDTGRPASLTFTSDFHELLEGEMLPGIRCSISYDPLRIAPGGCGFVHGSPEHPVYAHLLFFPGREVETVELVSLSGILREPVRRVDGQGSMLSGSFDIPVSAEGLAIWFSYTDCSGVVHYDSDYGNNYNFRFATRDLHLLQAVVVSDPQTPYSGFGLEVAAIPAVTAVSVRFRVVNDPQFGKQDQNLADTGKTDPDGNRLWSRFGLLVPYRSTVRFKLFYVIDGKRYKDDNGGRYFLAPQPQEAMPKAK